MLFYSNNQYPFRIFITRQMCYEVRGNQVTNCPIATIHFEVATSSADRWCYEHLAHHMPIVTRYCYNVSNEYQWALHLPLGHFWYNYPLLVYLFYFFWSWQFSGAWKRLLVLFGRDNHFSLQSSADFDCRFEAVIDDLPSILPKHATGGGYIS